MRFQPGDEVILVKGSPYAPSGERGIVIKQGHRESCIFVKWHSDFGHGFGGEYEADRFKLLKRESARMPDTRSYLDAITELADVQGR